MKSWKDHLNILLDSTVNNIVIVIIIETLIITTECTVILLGKHKEVEYKAIREPAILVYT